MITCNYSYLTLLYLIISKIPLQLVLDNIKLPPTFSIDIAFIIEVSAAKEFTIIWEINLITQKLVILNPNYMPPTLGSKA